MTLSTTTDTISYAGNGVTTIFSFPNLFFKNADLTVTLINDTTGIETLQAEITNYTVIGAGIEAGGSVTMLVAPAVGETLVIQRIVALSQLLDLVENDDLPSASLEETLDRSVMLSQQINSLLARTPKYSISSVESNVVMPEFTATSQVLVGDSTNKLSFAAFSSITLAAFDTVFTGLVDKDMMRYDNGLAKWVNEDIGEHITAKADTVVTAADEILFSDVTDSNLSKKDTVQGILDLVIIPAATTTVSGIVEKATSAEMTGGTLDKFPDALDIKAFVNVGNGPFEKQLLHITYETTGVIDGGTATSGSWGQRPLNTLKTNEITGATLTTNVISLPAGTYWTNISGMFYFTSGMQNRLRDTTNSVTLALSTKGFSSGAESYESNGSGRFTLSGTTNVELQYRVQVTRATSGLGLTGIDFSENNIFASIEIWKIG